MDLQDLTRTHFSGRTIATLREVSLSLPQNGVVVNIGAYLEASTTAILYDRPDLMAFSIDIELCQDGLDNLKALGLRHRVIRILGKSQDVGRYWNRPIDMVYVDGDHSYVSCKADILTWVPLVREGGLVAFHDYGTPHCPGVVQAIDELIIGQYDFVANDGNSDFDVLRIFRK